MTALSVCGNALFNEIPISNRSNSLLLSKNLKRNPTQCDEAPSPLDAFAGFSALFPGEPVSCGLNVVDKFLLTGRGELLALQREAAGHNESVQTSKILF